MIVRYEVVVLKPMPLVVIERSTFESKAEADAYAQEKEAQGHMTRTMTLTDRSQVYSLAVFRIRRDLEAAWRNAVVS